MYTQGGRLLRSFAHIDIPLLVSACALTALGLVTMYSFGAENAYFDRQIIWIAISIGVAVTASFFDFRFLRTTIPVAVLFGLSIASLLLIFVFGEISKGAQSRFDLGIFAVQPAEYAKLVLIILLAKYFARRHIEIAHIKHILISAGYAGVLFLLVFFQPDLGSAIIIGCIWLGMVLVAGISWKHLGFVMTVAALVSVLMWSFVLHDYQKERILTFLHPLADIQGAGYNAYQATIAVGSGQLLGKGIGYGTQSKLSFLPEYETDFIFAAYAEEWGFVGVLILFALFGILLARILRCAVDGATNFEKLFAAGVAIMLLSHFIVHVGMNVGLLPITGTTIPFMSYGGSHLLTEFAALGMLMGMRRYRRGV
ncbi:MAG: rod shape-determining protein RodA [Patescibacteria group bacterium]